MSKPRRTAYECLRAERRKRITPVKKPVGFSHLGEWNKPLRVVDIKKFITSLKVGKPCVDCGGVFLPCAMDFDHRDPSTKIAGIGQLSMGTKIHAIIEELKKCDLVCANCHRVRHYKRKHAHEPE